MLPGLTLLTLLLPLTLLTHTAYTVAKILRYIAKWLKRYNNMTVWLYTFCADRGGWAGSTLTITLAIKFLFFISNMIIIKLVFRKIDVVFLPSKVNASFPKL